MGIPVSNVKYVTVEAQVLALDVTKTRYAVSPVDGVVRLIHSVLDVAVDGDSVLVFKANGTEMTASTVTHDLATTAVGQVKASAPTGANDIKRGQTLSVTATGNGGTVGACRVFFLIEQV